MENLSLPIVVMENSITARKIKKDRAAVMGVL